MKIGQVLMLNAGEYSDKWTQGPFTVAKEFTMREAHEAFLAEWATWPEYADNTHKTRDWYDTPSPNVFVDWLLREGYIAVVDGVLSFDLGGYYLEMSTDGKILDA